MSTCGVHFSFFCFLSSSGCLLSVIGTTYSVSTFYGLYYLLGVYFRCLLCVLLLSVFRRDRGVYFRWSVLPASGPRASTSRLSVKMEVSTSGGPYDLHGVYFLWSVLSTRCLLSVSTLRASALRQDRGVYFRWSVLPASGPLTLSSYVSDGK